MKNFKEDFGLYLKNSFNLTNHSVITIVDSFLIHSLILYPNHTSSISATIENRMATFDFNDSVLKVFIWVLTNLNLINRPDIEKQIMDQGDEPIRILFHNEKAYVTGMVLTCKFGKEDKSVTTNEEFLSLIIESAKIVQEPTVNLAQNQPMP